MSLPRWKISIIEVSPGWTVTFLAIAAEGLDDKDDTTAFISNKASPDRKTIICDSVRHADSWSFRSTATPLRPRDCKVMRRRFLLSTQYATCQYSCRQFHHLLYHSRPMYRCSISSLSLAQNPSTYALPSDLVKAMIVCINPFSKSRKNDLYT